MDLSIYFYVTNHLCGYQQKVQHDHILDNSRHILLKLLRKFDKYKKMLYNFETSLDLNEYNNKRSKK